MRLQLKLRTFFFAVITIGLVAVTIFLGRVVYSDLYRKILLSFDQKLLAASTVVASFVSGEDHNKVIQVTQLRGITASNGQIYGRFFGAPGLEQLNPDTRQSSVQQLQEEPWYVEDITSANGLIFAAGPENEVSEEIKENPEGKPSIIWMNPVSGEIGTWQIIDEPCRGIAYLENSIYCAGPELLLRIPMNQDGSAGQPADVLSFEKDTKITGLGASADGKFLIATDTDNKQLLWISPVDGIIARAVKLHLGKAENPYPFGVFSITYDSIRRKYFGVSTVSFLEINPDTGQITELPGFGFGPPESQRIYRNLVEPMIRVRKGTEIYFLYSAILVDRESTIIYALDSTQSNIHSNVGYADPDPPKDDIRDVILKREIYLSDIEPWEEWGLLKSAYVPILNREGDAVAYSGADVNIDIIESKTRLALLQVVIIGLVALIAGLLIAYFITERLTSPIQKLKQSALRVAAGDFGNEIHVERPAELTRLSGSLTALSRSLQETVTSLTGENFRLEEKRRRNELMNLVRSFMKHRSAMDYVDVEEKTDFGVYEDGQYTAVWVCCPTDDHLRTTRIHSDLFRISRRLLSQRSDQWLATMKPMVGHDLHFAVLIYRDAGRVEIAVDGPTTVYLASDQSVQRQSVDSEGDFSIKSVRAVYVEQGAQPDRTSEMQGKPQARIKKFKEKPGMEGRMLEVLL